MRVTPGSEIGGVRLSDLKPALRRVARIERATTPEIGLDLVMLEPRLSAFLAQLADAGYLVFDGTEGYLDRWRLGEVGRRLLASRIQHPMSRATADRLVARLLARAREVNAAEFACAVTSVSVFGSYLGSVDTLGDLDVIVETARRPEPPGRNLAREALARAPEWVLREYRHELDWPETEVLREIRAVSPRISLHGFHEVENLGAAYLTLYRYDPKTNTEGRPDDAPRTPATNPDETSAPPPRRRAGSRACIDPASPPDAPAIARPRHLAGASMARTPVTLGDLEAQHMWANGADLATIQSAARRDALSWPPTERTLRDLIASLYARTDDPARAEVPAATEARRDSPQLLDDTACDLMRESTGEPVIDLRLARFRNAFNPTRFRGRPTRIRRPETLHPALVDSRLAGLCVRLSASTDPGGVDSPRVDLDVLDLNGSDLLACVRSGHGSGFRRLNPLDAANRDLAEAAGACQAAAIDWAERLAALLDGAGFRLTLHLDGALEPPDGNPGMTKTDRAALSTADLARDGRELIFGAGFLKRLPRGARPILLIEHGKSPWQAQSGRDDCWLGLFDTQAPYPRRRGIAGGGPRDRLAPVARRWRARNAGFLGALKTFELEIDLG